MSDQMLSMLHAEIGRLVMENVALRSRVHAAEAELKELRKDIPPIDSTPDVTPLRRA